MQITEERAPQGCRDVYDIIGPDELEAIASKYEQTAGFDRDTVHQAAGRVVAC